MTLHYHLLLKIISLLYCFQKSIMNTKSHSPYALGKHFNHIPLEFQKGLIFINHVFTKPSKFSFPFQGKIKNDFYSLGPFLEFSV